MIEKKCPPHQRKDTYCWLAGLKQEAYVVYLWDERTGNLTAVGVVVSFQSLSLEHVMSI